MRKGQVDFSKILREWDGFGFNYVETCQTPDYEKNPQDYGGFSILKEEDRQRIVELVFGEDGLKPGVIKMFLDPFHQKEENQNDPDPNAIDMSNYDHETATRWMRYFVKEGLKKTRAWGGDLSIVTTLYGPPPWMTKQKFMRGRDLDPVFKYECAKYMIAWAKYLREAEGLPVKYISLHNEGEDYMRWPDDGSEAWLEHGHDYNMYWPPEQVVDFIKFMREMLDSQGLNDVGVTPGETTNWARFVEWGYADAIADDPDAAQKLGIITSHGFYSGNFGRWNGDHRSQGIDAIREKRPDIHAWVTSTSWSKMDAKFVFEMFRNIYSAKVNAIIPWAGVQWSSKWVGGDPNPGTAIRVHDDGTFNVEPGYYYYKQVCRAGQPGMGVARTICNDSEIGIIAFSKNGTANPDAFSVINIAGRDRELPIEVIGTSHKVFDAYRTSSNENYVSLGRYTVNNGDIVYKAPAGSVTTFYGV